MKKRSESADISVTLDPINPKDCEREGSLLPYSGTVFTARLIPHVRNATHTGFSVHSEMFRGYTGSVGSIAPFGAYRIEPLSFWRILVSDAISDNSVPVADRKYFRGVLLRPVLETSQGMHDPNVLIPDSFTQLLDYTLHPEDYTGSPREILVIHNPVIQRDLSWLKERNSNQLESIGEHAFFAPMVLLQRAQKALKKV